nr:MAG TPA: hypothetical protein [Caudoviricetes sp.]
MAQLSYGEMSPAIVGQLADLSYKTVDSFAAEVALNPGDLVIRGTNAEKQVKLPASGTVKDAIGIVIHEHKEPGTAGGYYPIGYAVGVLTRGRIWVPVSKAVTAGKIANYKIAEKAFADEAVASGIEAPGVSCVFLTSTTAKGMAEIEVGHANVTINNTVSGS